MKKNMKTFMESFKPSGPEFPRILENQMDMNMKNEMETVVVWVILKILGPLLVIVVGYIAAPNIWGHQWELPTWHRSFGSAQNLDFRTLRNVGENGLGSQAYEIPTWHFA